MFEKIVKRDPTLPDSDSHNARNMGKSEMNELDAVENSQDFDSLLDDLIRTCQQPVSIFSAENSLCSSPYFEALQSVFKTYKDGLVFSPSHEINKLQEHSNALDRSLKDCISNIFEVAEKGDGDLTTNDIEESITIAYDELPKNIHFMNQEIDRQYSTVQTILNRHQTVRPISDADLENVKKSFQVKKLHWTNQIKNNICNASMAATSYFLKRQRRRNFPKKATRILNEYFEAHMKHPYPNEKTKERLAQACGVSIAQISNWFGNKRIRFKKSLDRQSQSSPKTRVRKA